MIHLRTFTALALSTALCACQTVGNGRALTMKPPELAQTLEIGRTVKADVQRKFGEASVYRMANGAEVWTYQKTEGLPKFVQFVPYLNLLPIDFEQRTTEVALLFDNRGVLRNVDWRGRDRQPSPELLANGHAPPDEKPASHP